MRAIDTNVLVRLFVRDDPAQAESAEAFVAPGAWVSHLVLAETVWVMDSVYDLTAARIAVALEMLIEHDRLVVQDVEVVRAALAAFKQQPAVGFTDCLIVEVARKLGHRPLGTFNRSMSRLDGAVRL